MSDHERWSGRPLAPVPGDGKIPGERGLHDQAVPNPDLDKPLDFAAITASGGNDPDQWPAAFQLDPDSAVQWLDLGQGHRVRARDNANPGEIF